jgi:outer membrane PBP1 activator LpoA protein
VKFQVIAAESIKTTALWYIAPCSLNDLSLLHRSQKAIICFRHVRNAKIALYEYFVDLSVRAHKTTREQVNQFWSIIRETYQLVQLFKKKSVALQLWRTLVAGWAAAAGSLSRLHQTVLGWHVVSTSNPTAAFSAFHTGPLLLYSSNYSVFPITRLSGPRSRPNSLRKILMSARESNPGPLCL